MARLQALVVAALATVAAGGCAPSSTSADSDPGGGGTTTTSTSTTTTSTTSATGTGGAAALPLGSACTADAQCNGGLAGQQVVCSNASHVCIAGCHADADCAAGTVCDEGQIPWACAAPPSVHPIGSSITGNYSPDAAVAYADAHWDDGKGLCAEFVADAAVVAGGLDLPYFLMVHEFYGVLTDAAVPFDEYGPGQASVRGCPGDLVIDSNDLGSNFCVPEGNDRNCGHIGLVVEGGDSVDTILADFHNSAHYHRPIGDTLSVQDLGPAVTAYSTLRVYHLANCAFY